MNRPLFACVLLALSAAAAAAQQAGQQNPYQGTSNPPANDAIVTDATPPAKPPAGKAMNPIPAAPYPAQDEASPAQAEAAQDSSQVQAAQPMPADPDANTPATGNNSGIVAVAPDAAPPTSAPALASRGAFVDPDGDIVQPRALRPGELGEGTTIRVRLLDRLSTAVTENGEQFHSQVANDVLQGGQVLIPAGTEIDGTVVSVSSGHLGGSGSMRLRPEAVILADGTRYRIYAEVTGTPGSRTHVVGEGTIKPDSRWKRDGVEYGGAVGVGAVTGAVIAGPVGALTGSLIGAGAVTTHL